MLDAAVRFLGAVFMIVLIFAGLVVVSNWLQRHLRRVRVEDDVWEAKTRADSARQISSEDVKVKTQDRTWVHSAENAMAQKDIATAKYEADLKVDTLNHLNNVLVTPAPQDVPAFGERLHGTVRGPVHGFDNQFYRNLVPGPQSGLLNEPAPLPLPPPMPRPVSLPPPPPAFPADGRSYEIPDPNGQWLNEEGQDGDDSDEGEYDEDDYDD